MNTVRPTNLSAGELLSIQGCKALRETLADRLRHPAARGTAARLDESFENWLLVLPFGQKGTEWGALRATSHRPTPPVMFGRGVQSQLTAKH
jgi:hypothetical protein